MKPPAGRTTQTNKKALAVISGGLDSTVSLFMAQKKYHVSCAILFHYGQKAFAMEKKACRRLTQDHKIELKIIDLKWLSTLSKSALFAGKQTIPRLTASDLKKPSALKKTAIQVMVHNRNMIFLSCAASLALEKNCHTLICGFNAEEAVTFPDNSCDFLASVNQTLALSTKPLKIRVISPTIQMEKKDIVRHAIKQKFPLNTVYSCYTGDKIMCGQCESCVRLKRALRDNDFLNRSGIRFQIKVKD